MKVIGILGGVASGKSFVSRTLAGLGAGVTTGAALASLVVEHPAPKATKKESEASKAAIFKILFEKIN